MTNEELKNKIVRILIDTDNYIVEKIKEAVENNTCFLTKENEYYDIVSDALIAAGLRFGENLTATFDRMALEREHELERRLSDAEYWKSVYDLALNIAFTGEERAYYLKRAQEELKGESVK